MSRSIPKVKIDRYRKLMQVNRIEILQILLQRETCTCEIVKSLELSNNLVSHHLKVLFDLGILDHSKNGLHVKYSIKSEERKRIKEMLELIGF